MIKRELAVFLMVGASTVLIDLCSYRALIWSGLAGVDLAKGIGFLAGMLFAYFANRAWTFGHKKPAAGSPQRFVLLYALTLGANVLINALALAWLGPAALAVERAFLLATGVSAVLNFLGMKYFVFKLQPAARLP